MAAVSYAIGIYAQGTSMTRASTTAPVSMYEARGRVLKLTCIQIPDEYSEWVAAGRASEETHLRRLIRQIDIDALCGRATFIRNGVKCFASVPGDHDRLKGLQFGGCNLHVEIKFDDGVTWLARFRLLKINRPSPEKVDFDRLSEVATYRLLRTTNIPVPSVYDFALDGDKDNPVGVGYILLEKLPGQPMNWSQATTSQKKHVFQQLKDVYLELEKIPQSSIGRPVFSSKNTDTVHVGACFFDYDSNERCIARGPFSTYFEWYDAYINRRRDLIMTGELAGRARYDAFLVNRYLHDNVFRALYTSTPSTSGSFFLKHVDSRDCNFLVDDDYTITGMIDWELAFFAPKDTAFQCPLFMVDVAKLYEGNPEIGPDEELFAQEFDHVNRRDMANIVRNGRKFRSIEFSVDTDTHNIDYFRALFAGAWRVIEGEQKEFSWDTWKKVAQVRYLDPFQS